MTIKKFFLLFSVTIFLGCGNSHSDYAILEGIDSLLAKEENYHAYERLVNIDPTDLMSEKDKAYYYLLYTITLVRLQEISVEDTAIDTSIRFYDQINDGEKLARSLYYKGMAMTMNGDNEEALSCIKKAESIVDGTKASLLLNYICINLSSINNEIGNSNTALKYAKKSLGVAIKCKNGEMACLSMNKISNAFTNLEQHDSALFYAEKAIPYIRYVNTKYKASILSDISASYFNQNYMHEAQRYVIQSLETCPTSHAYYILGIIYLEQGKGDEALALWRKAAETGTPELRAETMLWTADLKKERGEYRESAELMAKAEALKDSISRAKDTENMLRLQADMRHADTERKAGERLAAIVVVAVLAAIVLAALLAYYRKRAGKAKRRLAEIGKLADKYRQRIDELSSSKVENERVINRLKRKMETLRRERAAIIGRGLKLCEDIKGGGTVTTWKREDFEAAVEYCRTMWPEAVNEIESGYKRLTPYNTFFLLLPVIGIADNDIPHAMNMSPGAVRTAKYRLKGKRSVTA